MIPSHPEVVVVVVVVVVVALVGLYYGWSMSSEWVAWLTRRRYRFVDS